MPSEEGEGTETEDGSNDTQTKSTPPTKTPQTALKVPAKTVDTPQKFFGPSYSPENRHALDVPKIELPNDSDRNSSLGGLDASSLLAEDVFETLKAKKTTSSSNDSTSYPSTMSTGVSPHKDITASSSPLGGPENPPVVVSSAIPSETDNVFVESPTFVAKDPTNDSGANSSTGGQLKTLGLPNSSPPTASRSPSPRLRPSLNDLPKLVYAITKNKLLMNYSDQCWREHLAEILSTFLSFHGNFLLILPATFKLLM